VKIVGECSCVDGDGRLEGGAREEAAALVVDEMRWKAFRGMKCLVFVEADFRQT